MKVKVSVKGASFYAFHGFYPEERKSGHNFIVSVDVWYDKKTESNENIADTINYELIYNIVQEEINIARILIETLVESILTRVLLLSTDITKAKVTVGKVGPQLGGPVDSTRITMTKKRKHE
ncbi:MAG: dihydroneopterin aldolase [Saprospiraceae bacterium]